MTDPRDQRTSADLEEGETAPLLASERDDEAGQTSWKDYPAKAWSQTSNYFESLRQSASERGKRRQIDSEREGPDTLAIPTENIDNGTRLHIFKAQHPRLYPALAVLISLILIVLFLVILAIAHLFFITLRTPNEETQQRITGKAFSMDGPDQVHVMGVNGNGLTVSVSGRIGVDSKSGLDEWLGERQSKGWYNRKERDVIDWAVSKIEGVQVDVGSVALRSPDWSKNLDIDEVHLIPDNDTNALGNSAWSTDSDGKLPKQAPTNLVTLDLEPIYVPFHALGAAVNVNGGPEAKTPVNLTIVLKPSGPDLMVFARNALKARKAILDVNVASVHIRGLNAKEWKQKSISTFRKWSVPGYIDVSVGDTWKRLGQKVPKIEGNDSTDPFLNLTRYDFFEIGRDAVSSMAQRALGIKAYAEAKNPLGKLLYGHVEYSLPFGIFLPLESKNASSTKSKEEGVVLLAAVATEPIDLKGEAKIQLQLQGRVVPPPQPPFFSKRDQVAFNGHSVDKTDAGADALSGFLSRFLRGESNTVYVHGGSPFTEPALTTGNDVDETPLPGGGSALPAWLDKILRTLKLPIAFPGNKVTDLIQNVTINDLKITPHPFEDEKLLCSGTVMGVMNMPGALAGVDVEITDLWPDILVYNGKPPSMRHGNNDSDTLEKRNDNDNPKPEPLPDPLPSHAFGRVTPHGWAPAKTFIDPEDPKKQRKLLYSQLKDVPFTVLPGRSAEFRSFSWKIVTGEGARAGIEGTAKAKIWNSGLGKLVLSNLPVKGVFTVGKRGDSGGDGDDDGDDGFAR